MLLNREELMDALDAKRKECHLENEYIGFDLAYSVVESMCTEPDVELVRHGEWICNLKGRSIHIRECSVCGHHQGHGLLSRCPNCGAKMDA